MRGLSLTLAMLLSTAIVAAQRRTAPSPPPRPAPPPSTTSPTVLPFPPLMTQPAGGLTPGVTFPFRDHPVYSANRFMRPGRGGYGGAYGDYGGGYFYAPDTQPTPSAPASVAEPTGLLRLSGTPASAQVFVDGYYVATLSDIEAQRALTLTSGPHRIELKAADYTSTTFDVRIDPNDTVTYRAALEHVRPQPPARSAAPAAGPTKMYLIPNCYLGNVPPKTSRLPQGCDIKRVQEIS